MRLTTSTTLLLSLVFCVSAISIPAPIDSSDESSPSLTKRHIEGSDDLSPSPTKPELEARQTLIDDGQHSFCGCGITMNRGDTDAAVADLKAQLNEYTYIPPGQSYYSIRGGAVAFACHYGSEPKGIAGDILRVVFKSLTGRCGQYVPSTKEDFDSSFAVGYMNYTPGLDFCGHARSSAQHKC
jgi:hypothetical protein